MSSSTQSIRLCPEFLDKDSPQGLEVFDIAPDAETSSLTYPDKPTFLEDGRRMFMATASGPQICHLDEGCRLEPIKPFAPGIGKKTECSLTPGGRYLIYTARDVPEDQLVVRRIDLRTNTTEDVFSASGNIPGTPCAYSKFHIQAASRDGRHFAGRVYLGDGKTHQAGYAIIILDADTGESRIIFKHENLNNPHLQYSRAPEAPAMYDLMVQMNHGSITDEKGEVVLGLGPPSDLGVDVHVINDDGSNWRDMPFGRDGREGTIGHQVWRGSTQLGATITLQNNDISYGWSDGTTQHIVSGEAVPADPTQPHMGKVGRDDKRVVLSQDFDRPRFCHLGVDDTGLRFAFDTFPQYRNDRSGMLIYIGQTPDFHSPARFQYILNTGVAFVGARQEPHAHPILSPGGKELFFNSNLYGPKKAYMVRNLPWHALA